MSHEAGGQEPDVRRATRRARARAVEAARREPRWRAVVTVNGRDRAALWVAAKVRDAIVDDAFEAGVGYATDARGERLYVRMVERLLSGTREARERMRSLCEEVVADLEKRVEEPSP